MLQALDWRDRGLMKGRPMLLLLLLRVPQLPLRLAYAGVMPISEMVGEEATELAEEVVPNSLWVD